MAEPEFPDLPGLGWSVTKSPRFSTRIQTSVSGRELRLADQFSPIWEWTLTYEILRDPHDTRQGQGLGSGYDELRQLAGFFLARRGSFEAFLFKDPSDHLVQEQYFGTGDGINRYFQLVRTFGAFHEPITAPLYITLYANGNFVPYDLFTTNFMTGMVIFYTAPPAGIVLTSDVEYRFRVRFSDDSSEYENFLYQLWSAKEIKLRSVLL
jgi:uncharacterized protein (TIGR02217 family)